MRTSERTGTRACWTRRLRRASRSGASLSWRSARRTPAPRARPSGPALVLVRTSRPRPADDQDAPRRDMGRARISIERPRLRALIGDRAPAGTVLGPACLAGETSRDTADAVASRSAEPSTGCSCATSRPSSRARTSELGRGCRDSCGASCMPTSTAASSPTASPACTARAAGGTSQGPRLLSLLLRPAHDGHGHASHRRGPARGPDPPVGALLPVSHPLPARL